MLRYDVCRIKGKGTIMKRYISALGIVLFYLILWCFAERSPYIKEETEKKNNHILVESYGKKEYDLFIGPSQWLGESLSEERKQMLIQAYSLQGEDVYSFLQGPRSWSEGIPWSGEWCEYNINGNTFGGFGCGLCCMANIYDTLSPYEVSPMDMFEFAKQESKYSPDGRAGAIGWVDMRDALGACGVICRLCFKPDTYEEFQQEIAQAKSAVVLISSGYDDTFWQDTPGHYVNIWLYEEESDTVFLAEPGSPENNRSRIPLRYIYDALKLVSTFQYMTVERYSEVDNHWKADGIDDNWNRP